MKKSLIVLAVMAATSAAAMAGPVMVMPRVSSPVMIARPSVPVTVPRAPVVAPATATTAAKSVALPAGTSKAGAGRGNITSPAAYVAPSPSVNPALIPMLAVSASNSSSANEKDKEDVKKK